MNNFLNNLFKLEGKVVLLTGAGGHLVGEMARACGKAGMKVVCADFNLDSAMITKNDILLPGIDNCRSCHAPAKFVAGVAQAGVNHDCVECHSYHHGDQPFQGVGAAAWDPKILRTIEQMQKPIP